MQTVALNLIAHNRSFYEDIRQTLEELIRIPKHFTNATRLALMGDEFLTSTTTGYYSSPLVERPFLLIGQQIPMPGIPAKVSGTLHVMTAAYALGGHTAYVANWIANWPSPEPHSLLLTGQAVDGIPDYLREAVRKSGGSIHSTLDAANIMRAGAVLRSLALAHERVVLSTHMDDLTPVIAFGHPDFPRPVLFFNHASHDYSVGRSVTDAFIAHHPAGLEIIRDLRGGGPVLTGKFILQDRETPLPPREDARRELGIPPEAVLVLSVGMAGKFAPLCGYDFFAVIRKNMERCGRCWHAVIGPHPGSPLWGGKVARGDGRLILPGLMDRDTLDTWLAAADIYLDSFPFEGATALLDAIQADLPAVSLRVFGSYLPFFEKAGFQSGTEEELLETLGDLVNDPSARDRLAREQRGMAEEEYSAAAWARDMEAIRDFTGGHTITRDWTDTYRETEFEIMQLGYKLLNREERNRNTLNMQLQPFTKTMEEPVQRFVVDKLQAFLKQYDVLLKDFADTITAPKADLLKNR